MATFRSSTARREGLIAIKAAPASRWKHPLATSHLMRAVGRPAAPPALPVRCKGWPRFASLREAARLQAFAGVPAEGAAGRQK